MALPALDLSQFAPAAANNPLPAATLSPATLPGSSTLPQLDLSQFSAAPPAPAAPDRSGIGEVATGAVRGLAVDLPQIAGKALQFVSPDGSAVNQFGQGLVDNATMRGQSAGLTLNPSQHGGVTNFLAQGAEGLTSALAIPAAVSAGVAAAPEVVAGAAGAAGLAAGGLVFGAASGQDTLEQAKAKGVSPDDARTAAWLNAGATAASQVALGAVGGKFLGLLGSAAGKVVGTDGASLTGQIMDQLTGQDGIVKPFLKSLPGAAAEAVGIGAAQAAATGEINQQYGIDDTGPLQAVKDSIVPMLGMAAAAAPLGLVGRALAVRSAVQRSATLAHPDTAPEIRSQLADQYATALAAPGTPEAQQAAAAFRTNAENAIQGQLPLPVNSELFNAGTIPAQGAPAEINPQGQGEIFPGAPAPVDNNAPPVAEPVAPSVDPNQRDLGLPVPPTPEEMAARQADLANLHDQVKSALTNAGITPDDVMSQADFAQTGQGQGLKGQALTDAYDAYTKDPATQEAVMRSNADKYETLTQAAPPTTPDYVTNTQMSDAMQAALKQHGEDQALSQLAEQPAAALYGDAALARVAGAAINRRAGEAEAAAAEAGTIQPDANAPKTQANISDDLDAVNAEQGFSTTGSAKAGFERRLGALDLTSLPDHQSQIDKLEAAAKDAPPATQERMNALLAKWKAELPAPEDALANAPDQSVLDGTHGDTLTDETGAPIPEGATLADTTGDLYPRNEFGRTALQENSHFAKATGAVNGAAGHYASARVNIAAGKAATAGDLPGTIAALGRSKNVVIQRIAQLAQGLAGHSIKIDPDAMEQQQVQSKTQNETAKAVIGRLDALRAIKARFEATKIAPETTRAYSSDTPEAFAKRVGSDQRMADIKNGGVFRQAVRDTPEYEASHDAGGEGLTHQNLDAKIAQVEGFINSDGNDEAAWRREAGRTPHDVTRVAGSYDSSTKTVTVRSDYDARNEHVLGHELTHALTVKAIDAPTEAQRPVVAKLQKLFEHVKASLGDEHYGTTSIHEFVAEGMSNPKFQRELHGLKYQNSSVWSRFTQHVADLLGIKHGTAFTELLNLHDELHSEADAPQDRAQPGENIHPATPETGEPSPGTARVLDSMPGNLSIHDQVQAAADKMRAVAAELRARQQSGARLSELEQDRLADAQWHGKGLDALNNLPGGPPDNEHTQALLGFAKEAETPYKKSPLRLYKEGTPGEPNPALQSAIARSSNVNDTLDVIAKNSRDPEARALAAKYQGMGLDTTIEPQPEHPAGPGVAGEFDPNTNHIDVYPAGMTEHNVLHEVSHAATYDAVEQAQTIGMPRTQREAELKRGLGELEAVRASAARIDPAHYGLSNVHELIAEARSNPEFQDFLRNNSDATSPKTLWNKFVDATRKLLGLPDKTNTTNFLDRTLTASNTFDKPDSSTGFPLAPKSPAETLFNKSPSGAAQVTDDRISRLTQMADKFGLKLSIDRLRLSAFKNLLGWKTVEYTAGRADASPRMVANGVAGAIHAYLNAHHVMGLVARHIEAPLSDYAGRLKTLLRGEGSAGKARALNEWMSAIGLESSRMGSDFTRNHTDNTEPKAEGGLGLDIPAKYKPAVDEIHREFTKLRQANPKAAQALIDGAKLTRKSLIENVSTIVRTRLDNAAGTATRLSAELNRMAPDDALRAAQEAKVNNANLESLLAHTHAEGLDLEDKSLVKERGVGVAGFHDRATAALAQRLDAAFAAARQLPEGSPLRAQLTEFESMYRAQSAAPYFALTRNGGHFVSLHFRNMDEATQAKLQQAMVGSGAMLGDLMGGQTHAFIRVKNADQSVGLRRKLEAAGGGKVFGGSNGLLADKNMVSAAGTSQVMRDLLANLQDAVDQNPHITGAAADEMKATLTRQVLSLLPETSSRSAKMQRTGVAGYNADFLGSFAKWSQGAIQNTSQIYAQRAFDGAFKQMGDAAANTAKTNDTDLQNRTQMIGDELRTRYANGMKPMDNSAVNLINAFGHTFYLAISPAYLIRAMAQPFHRAMPYIGSRYGNVNASKEIAGATGTAIKIIANTIRMNSKDGMQGLLQNGMKFDNLGLPDSHVTFLQELHDRGELNLGQARQLQMMDMGGSQIMQNLTRMASMTAQYAEMAGRIVTGLAAFRLAEKGSSNVTQAGRAANTEYAIGAIHNTMDNFDQYNTARQIGKYGFAGKVTPLFTAFMNYDLQTMQQIARTVHDGVFNVDQSAAGVQRSAEAKKEFATLFATTAMISGAMGLPFVNAFAGVYNSLNSAFGNQNDPSDIRIDAQHFLANLFGQNGGDLVAHGLGHVLNMDTSTFGLQDLLPGSEFLASRQKLQDRLADQSQQLIGPALNAGVDILTATNKMLDGHYVKGIEQALPSGIKPYFKAADLATNGYTNSQGDPLPGPAPSGWAIGLQAAGFRTEAKAVRDDKQEFVSAQAEKLADRRALIADRFYKATQPGNQGDMPGVMADVAAYNAANPTQPMRDLAGGLRTKIQDLALGNVAGSGVALNRGQFVSMLPKLQFGPSQ